MLTKKEALFRREGNRVWPDRLTRKTHAQYPALAAEMLAIYRAGKGEARGDLWERIRALFHKEHDVPVQRREAFLRLLDEQADFGEKSPRDVARQRMRIFELAALHHPLARTPETLLCSNEREVKAAIAKELGEPWEALEAGLFEDVVEMQRLRAFPDALETRALLTRYNEAQLQAALYPATELTIRAVANLRPILMAAKREGLLHEARALPEGGYELRFFGPATSLRPTSRYGVHFAGLIPTLLASRGPWEMCARLKKDKWGRVRFVQLSSEDQYSSSKGAAALEAFDSRLEETFFNDWNGGEQKDERGGWHLERESTPLFCHQKTFFPDFTLAHPSGCRVPLEIIGFWSPQYLDAKIETLRLFAGQRLLLAVDAKHKKRFEPLTGKLGFPVHFFKKKPDPDAILSMLPTLA